MSHPVPCTVNDTVRPDTLRLEYLVEQNGESMKVRLIDGERERERERDEYSHIG